MATKREITVGAFVFVGLLATLGVIFTIGNEKRVFDPKVIYTASFVDVQGLKPGAPIRLSGIDIGTVVEVGHGPNPNDDRLYLKLEIVRSEAGRIREDSVAKIANKGLLGDKMLDITPGTPGKAQLPAGGSVKSEDPADYSALLGQVGTMAQKAERILANLEKTTGALADDGVQRDVQQSLKSVNIILNSVAMGEGYMGKLLRDPGEAERISHVVTDLDRTAAKLNTTIDGVNHMLERINKGPGLAHSIIYEDDGKKMMTSVGDAANEAALTLRGVREGNGLAKVLIYGGPGQEKVGENFIAMSTDMRAIIGDVRKGKGTIGGLLTDPSIYEDMKSVLGNVQRNDTLRALVRYSIKQDEKKPAVEVKGEAKPELKAPAPSGK